MSLVRSSPWLAPVVLVPCFVGVIQPAVMLASWFRNTHPERDWIVIKYLTLSLFLVICVGFLFTMKRPKAHTLYVSFPLVFIYSLYCWTPFADGKAWKTLVGVTLVTGIFAEGSYAIHGAFERSLYRCRQIPLSAIGEKNYRLLGERRAGARY